ADVVVEQAEPGVAVVVFGLRHSRVENALLRLAGRGVVVGCLIGNRKLLEQLAIVWFSGDSRRQHGQPCFGVIGERVGLTGKLQGGNGVGLLRNQAFCGGQRDGRLLREVGGRGQQQVQVFLPLPRSLCVVGGNLGQIRFRVHGTGQQRDGGEAHGGGRIRSGLLAVHSPEARQQRTCEHVVLAFAVGQVALPVEHGL